jgi:hypothetical protein
MKAINTYPASDYFRLMSVDVSHLMRVFNFVEKELGLGFVSIVPTQNPVEGETTTFGCYTVRAMDNSVGGGLYDLLIDSTGYQCRVIDRLTIVAPLPQ